MSMLFPAAAVAALFSVVAARRLYARRRLARLSVSGGRKSFVLNLSERR